MWSIRDKVCVLTGASSGIGKETALGLARRGARLALVCRDQGRGEAVQRAAQRAGSPEVFVYRADLSKQSEVRDVARRLLDHYPRLEVLISNAGVVMPRRELTVDGREVTLAVNHLAPFLLTSLLLQRLRASAPARIVVVASQVESNGAICFDDLDLAAGYEPLKAYNQSKLANVMFTYALARRLNTTGVTANCLHPGVIATNLLCDYMGRPRGMSHLHRISYPSPKRGAEPSLHLASSPELGDTNGRYFRPEGEARSSPQSYDEALQERLWARSAELTGVTDQSE